MSDVIHTSHTPATQSDIQAGPLITRLCLCTAQVAGIAAIANQAIDNGELSLEAFEDIAILSADLEQRIHLLSNQLSQGITNDRG